MYKYATTLESMCNTPNLRQQCEAREQELGYTIDTVIENMDKYASMFPEDKRLQVIYDAAGFYMCKYSAELKAELEPFYESWKQGFDKVAQQTRLAREQMQQPVQPTQPVQSYADYATPAATKTVSERTEEALGGGVKGAVGSMLPYAIPGVGTAYGLADAGTNFYNAAMSSGQSGWQRAGHAGMGLMNLGLAGASLIPGGGLVGKMLGKGISKGVSSVAGKMGLGKAVTKMTPVGSPANWGKAVGSGPLQVKLPGTINSMQRGAGTAINTADNALGAVQKSKPGQWLQNNPLTKLTTGDAGWQQAAKGWGTTTAPLPGTARIMATTKTPGFVGGAKRVAGQVAGHGMTAPVAGMVGAGQLQTAGAEAQGAINHERVMSNGNSVMQ